MATKIVNSLAGLPAEITVKKLIHRSNYEELWISFPESERICPHCGSDKPWLLTGNEVNIKDITIV